MFGTWNWHICSYFLTARDGQNLLAQRLAYGSNSINIIVFISIKLVPQCGSAQTNNVSCTVITSQRIGHKITRFQEENVIEDGQPSLVESMQELKGKPSKIQSEGPWGPMHCRKCSKDLNGQHHPGLHITVQLSVLHPFIAGDSSMCPGSLSFSLFHSVPLIVAHT